MAERLVINGQQAYSEVCETLMLCLNIGVVGWSVVFAAGISKCAPRAKRHRRT